MATNPNKKLLKKYKEMYEEAIEYVKLLVVDKFKKNNNIHYFVIAMGTYFFVDIHGNILHDFKYKRLDDFISDWNGELKLTGAGFKMYRDGKIITDW